MQDNIHVCYDINDIKNIINLLSHPIYYIYISFGSKITINTAFKNNSIYQLLPDHLNTTNKSTISISVDNYDSNEINYASKIINKVFTNKHYYAVAFLSSRTVGHNCFVIFCVMVSNSSGSVQSQKVFSSALLIIEYSAVSGTPLLG